MEQTNLTFQCEDCKKYFSIDANQGPNLLAHKKEFISNEQLIFLTYYDCPHCGKRHFVQIDDVSSLQELTRVKNEFVNLAIMKKKGKAISKKKSDKFKKSRQHLSAYRIKLMKEFTGKVAIDNETGAEHVLRFSI